MSDCPNFACISAIITMNSCNICQQRFNDEALLQSNSDEYFCKECFKHEYCSATSKKKKAKEVVSSGYEGDSRLAHMKMFSVNELAMIRQQREANASYLTISKRPLQCPHMDCNRYVSVLDLTAHFQYEHMEISIIPTQFDTRNPVVFQPRDIRYGIKQCIMLLNLVSQKDDKLDKTLPVSSNVPGEKPQTPQVTIAVLASRIAAAQLTDEQMIEDEENSGIVGRNDKIIIWASSNTVTNFSYTIAVSTVSEDVRVKYYGPVLQLGNSPDKLCREGHCLILSHYHFLGMSENGLKPLHLDVIIHSED